MLSPQEQKWFNDLTAKRQNTVNVLKEEGLLEVFVSHIVDTYRESAPFDPDGEIRTNDLHQVKYIEQLAGTLKECQDQTQGFLAENIEKALWGSETYIEDNAFPTAHQDVNIYFEPAKKYEIRQDDNAVDIQIRNLNTR